MNTKIKILHLEDSLIDSELICSRIKDRGIAFEYFLAQNKKEFVNTLEAETIDLVLSDFNLSGYNGNEAMKFVKENYSSTPFIFVSGTLGEDSYINAMINGATDCVLKHKLERLVPTIKRAIYEQELENNRKLAQESLKESQEMLQKARKLAQLGVWEWKAKDDTVTLSKELYQIAGLDPTLPAPTFAEHSSFFTPKSWLILQTAIDRKSVV